MAKNEILSKFEKPRVHFRAIVNIQNCPTLIFKKDCLYLGHCNNHRSSRLSSPLIFELWLHNLRAMEKNCQELNNWIMCFLLFKSLLNNLFFFWIHTNLGTTYIVKNRKKGPIFFTYRYFTFICKNNQIKTYFVVIGPFFGFPLYSVEISGFFYHTDFTWNQF